MRVCRLLCDYYLCPTNAEDETVQRGDGAVGSCKRPDRATFVLQFVLATAYDRQECKENATMAHIPIPHTARLGVLYTTLFEPVQCELTFAVRDDTDAIFANPATYSSDVFGAVVSALVPHSYANVVYTGITFEDVRSVPYVGADYPLASTPGSLSYIGHGALPTSAALSVKRVTAAVGRGGRGRVYWPLMLDNECSAPDHVASARAAEIVAALAAFQADVEALVAGSQMVVVSTEFAKAPRVTGVTNHITAWGVPDLLVDSQRRRLLGRGR